MRFYAFVNPPLHPEILSNFKENLLPHKNKEKWAVPNAILLLSVFIDIKDFYLNKVRELLTLSLM